MERQEINPPKSEMIAKGKLFHKMYLSNISKRLRELNQPTENDKKRWIWELLQNAKDTIAGNPERNNVKARIEIEGDEVRFRHDGEPFTSDTKFALLYKYSEDKENEGSTGRFGTGFLTTHCLSKTVSIESNIYGDNDNINSFSVTMYRDGTTESELLDGLKKMEGSDKFYQNKVDWTTFTYHINSDSGREAVRLGVENFKENIAQVFLFCSELSSVELDDNGEKTSIERLSDESISDFLYKATFKITEGEKAYLRTFIYSSIEEEDEELTKKYKSDKTRHIRLQVACEVDADNNIVSTGDNTSLFCVFPLVGIESQLQMPIIVNSPDFEPDTERQSLLLNGNNWDEEKDIITEVGINQKILSLVPTHFDAIVQYLSKQSYKKFYHLCNGLRSVKEHEKLNKEWYKDNIVKSLREVLLKYDVVLPYKDDSKLCKLSECIVVDEKKEYVDRLFMLLTQIYGDKLVKDNNLWAKALWKDDNIPLWNTEAVCEDIEDMRNLSEIPIDGEKPTIEWYNNFLSFVLDYDKLLLENYALLPNMNGEFMLSDEEGFKQGEGVTKNVLDVLKEMGEDMRPLLLHEGIIAVKLDRKFNSNSFSAKANELAKEHIEDMSLTIEETVRNLLPLLSITVDNEDKYGGSDFITKRKRMFELTTQLFELSDVTTKVDNSFVKSAWERTDEWLTDYIIRTIADNEELSAMPDGLGAKWISDALLSLKVSKKALNDYAVLPNQEGDFCKFDDLYIDTGVSEALKDDVFKHINMGYKEKLLHKDIDGEALGLSKSVNNTDFYRELERKTRGCDRKYDTFPLLAYGLYRKNDEASLRHVAQYLIQVLPNGDGDGDLLKKQTILRETARFFIGDACKDIDTTIEIPDVSFWNNINEFICRDIIGIINNEEYSDINSLCECLNCDEDTLFNHLNVLYKNLGNIKLNNKAIFVNQCGQLATEDSLYSECESGIDKTLKDIIKYLSEEEEDYYSILLDKRCQHTISRQKTQEDAYHVIDDTMKSMYGNPNNWEDEDYKEAARLLIDEWGENNSEIFDVNHFPKVYPIKDSISMNVVWTKSVRQQLQTIKNSLSEEQLASLAIDGKEMFALKDKNKELEEKNAQLEEENAKLKADIERLLAGQTLEIGVGGENRGLSKEQQYEAQIEAQLFLKSKRPDWQYPKDYGEKDDDGTPKYFSTVTIVDELGQDKPIVLKSYKDTTSPFKIGTNEWQWIVEDKATLLVYTKVDNGSLDIVELTRDEIITNQSGISISFSTENLDVDEYSERVSAFANTLRYFKGLHFDFEKFNISRSARSVQDIYAKHEGTQMDISDDDL